MSFRANSELLILLIIINYNRDKYISYQHIPDSILVQFASFNTCPEGLVMSAEKGIDLKLVDFKDLDLKKNLYDFVMWNRRGYFKECLKCCFGH